MNTLPNGCAYSNVWVSPKNWTKATKKALHENWYVQCYFIDPNHPGIRKTYRTKVNEFKTIKERQDAVRFLLDYIPKKLSIEGYNPITKTYANFNPENDLHPNMLVTDAILTAAEKVKGSDRYKDEIRIAVNRFCTKFDLNYSAMYIKDIRYKHIDFTIESMELTDTYYNHVRSYICAVFNILIKFECVLTNYASMLDRRLIVQKKRDVLTLEQFKEIAEHLKSNFPEFYRFTMIFHLSGARIVELLNVKVEDVRINQQEYDVIIKKGSQYTRESKVILMKAIPFWVEVLKEAKSDQYVFSKNLMPGDTVIGYRQISKRWRTHVKQVFDIDVDFYALKHLLLDYLDQQQSENNLLPSIDIAQHMATHRSSNTTNRHYKTKKDQRIKDQLKQLEL